MSEREVRVAVIGAGMSGIGAAIHMRRAGIEDFVVHAGGCMSYYLDANGRNSTMFPGSTFKLRRRLARFDPADYVVNAAEPEPAAV